MSRRCSPQETKSNTCKLCCTCPRHKSVVAFHTDPQLAPKPAGPCIAEPTALYRLLTSSIVVQRVHGHLPQHAQCVHQCEHMCDSGKQRFVTVGCKGRTLGYGSCTCRDSGPEEDVFKDVLFLEVFLSFPFFSSGFIRECYICEP